MTIVKIQIPIAPRDADALLYDEGRSWIMTMPQDELPAVVRDAAQRDFKVYWHLVVSHGVLVFGERAPAQEW